MLELGIGSQCLNGLFDVLGATFVNHQGGLAIADYHHIFQANGHDHNISVHALGTERHSYQWDL